MTFKDFPHHSEQCWQSVLVVLHEHARLSAKSTGFVPDSLSNELKFVESVALYQYPSLRSFINLAYNCDNVIK